MLSRKRHTWLISVLAAIVISITLAACGVGESSPAGDVSAPVSVAAPSAGESEAAVPIGDDLATAASLEPDAIVAAHESVLAAIYEAVLPSVVRIEVFQRAVRTQGDGRGGSPFRFDPGGPDQPQRFSRQGEGSGFVWDEQGHIVTNNHVVAGAGRVTVVFSDGSEAQAQVVGTDPDSDLAVLKVELPAERLKPVRLGDDAELNVGMLAVAIGNPFGQAFTMTSGIVSALGRTIGSGSSAFSIPKAIQIDTAINPGNSGGPLLDRLGRVIGINSQIISRSGGSAGVGFAIPVSIARRVVPELIAGGKYEYAYLGIQGASLRPPLARANGLPEDTRGVLVATVVEGGPADNAGLRHAGETAQTDTGALPVGGDIITSIDGTQVKTMADLIVYLVENTRPGDPVTLGLIRKGDQSVNVDVTLSSRPG
jgi:S1-C subfamily serine protease